MFEIHKLHAAWTEKGTSTNISQSKSSFRRKILLYNWDLTLVIMKQKSKFHL